MFFRIRKMTPNRFEHLLSLVKNRPTKKETQFPHAEISRKTLLCNILNILPLEKVNSPSFTYRMVKKAKKIIKHFPVATL